MVLSRIHVNQHNIRANIKGANLPVITVKSAGKNTYGNTVEILDSNGQVIATVVYRPNHPLSCGAKVWIETEAEVRVE